MMTEDGARLQESMRKHPSVQIQHEFPFPLKGIIQKVYCKDQVPAQQYLADIDLMGGYPRLLKVPFTSVKVNKDAGVDWSPEEGDIVVVQFINGKFHDPIVTAYCYLPQELKYPDMQVASTDLNTTNGNRRYHRRCNKTDLRIDKDGNQIEYVEGYASERIKKSHYIHVTEDDTLTVLGKRTKLITGNEAIKLEGQRETTIENDEIVTVTSGDDVLTIQTGDYTVTLSQGSCTITIAGTLDINVDGAINMTSGTSIQLTAPRIDLN